MIEKAFGHGSDCWYIWGEMAKAREQLVTTGYAIVHLMQIHLIGYRGTGKTTVARLLAERLGWAWIDADVELERRAGKSIAAIFADEGEAAFRDLEAQVLRELVSFDHHVLSLGGGVVLRAENRASIQSAGPVVWLTARPETIADRMAGDATTASRRPNLTDSGGIEEIRRLIGEREPHYRQCASLQIDTECKSPVEVADEIIRKIGDTLGIGRVPPPLEFKRTIP
jgi:shikimate kinase